MNRGPSAMELKERFALELGDPSRILNDPRPSQAARGGLVRPIERPILFKDISIAEAAAEYESEARARVASHVFNGDRERTVVQE